MIPDMRDYCQTDGAYGGFRNGGTMFCGPTSVSNGVMWLDDHGYDNLVENTADRKEDQHDLIVALGYDMGVDPYGGVGVGGICNGLWDYVTERGYTPERLQAQSWRSIPSQFDTGIEIPTLEFVQEALRTGRAAAYVNVGWYNKSGSTYRRSGGHWLTIVGYGHDGVAEDPDFIILHDPSCGGDYNTIEQEYTEARPLPAGTTLDGSYGGLPRSAEGYFQLPDYKSRAIVDAFVVMVMPAVVAARSLDFPERSAPTFGDIEFDRRSLRTLRFDERTTFNIRDRWN
jgi:hypothetical protein